MTRTERDGRRKKARRNRGWFLKGYDACCSTYRLTPQDCRIGYLVAAIKRPELREWLKMKIRCFYYRKEAGNGPETNGDGHGNLGWYVKRDE